MPRWVRWLPWLRRRRASRADEWHVTFMCPADSYARLKRHIIDQGGEVISAARTNPSRGSPGR